MYGYIYEVTNMITNEKYIGRKKSDKFLGNSYLGSGTFIRKAVKKYGKENFKVIILEECFSEEDLNEKEIYWIKLYDAQKSELYYNICKGGKAGPGGDKFKGHKHSLETRKRMSENRKGSKNSNFGNRWKASESTLEKHRKNNKGEGNPAYGTKLMNNGIVAKRIPKEKVSEYLLAGWKLGSLPYKRITKGSTTIESVSKNILESK